jgi:uncharacterized protein YbjT (DUF2867 family)
MRLFVLGATGRTGQHLLDLGLARGHEIIAFVRSPHKIVRKDRALTVFWPSKLMTESAAAALAAMTKVAVSRFAVVSSALLFRDGRLRFRFFRWLIRHHLRDLEAMEAMTQESGRDYTVGRPPRLDSVAPRAHLRDTVGLAAAS